MSVILGFMSDLFVVIIFEFFLYVTGSIIIRLVTFEIGNKSILNFKDFRIEKKKFGQKYTLAVFTGLFFYIAIIVAIIALG